MLTVALPNKGALSEGAVELVKEAGYKCKRYGRELALTDTENDVEFVFLHEFETVEGFVSQLFHARQRQWLVM